jgi:predicted RNA-binding Zn ribbon-like protein
VSAPSSEPAAPPYVGGPLAVNLLNTVWMAHGEPVDFFAERANVQRWLDDNGVAARATAPVVAALLEARDAMGEVLTGGGEPAYDRLNRVLARGSVTVRLDGDNDVVRTVHSDDPAWRPAVLAVMNLVELLERYPSRIRQCEHGACVLWFLDTSRNGTRRWHSMATCGNRAKAQRHYARTRPTKPQG